VDFTNTSTGDSSWQWDFGDTSGSSAQNPSHLYLATGDYSVSLTINGTGDTATKTVSVAGPCP
jgi:PKD repeat protein